MDLVGKKIPSATLAGSDGKSYTTGELLGRTTVFYFYPKDSTPGCTIENKQFSELLPEFTKKNVMVFGVSADSMRRHENFIKKCDLSVVLLSDPDHLLIKPLGLLREKKMFGKAYMGVARVTLLVSSEGVIEKVWDPVKPNGHPREVLKAL